MLLRRSGDGLARVALVHADKIREPSGGHGEVRGKPILGTGRIRVIVQRFLDDIAWSASHFDQLVPKRAGIFLGATTTLRPMPDAIGIARHAASEDGGGIPRGRHEDGRVLAVGIDESEHGRHVEVGEVAVRSRVRRTDSHARWAQDLTRESTREILRTLVATLDALPIGEDERVEFNAVALLDGREREFGIRIADVAHEIPPLGRANANPHAPHLSLALASRIPVDRLVVQDDAAMRGRGREVLGLGLGCCGGVRHGAVLKSRGR